MDEARDNPITVPRWIEGICKWLWRKRGFLFGTIILSGLVNIAAGLVLVDPSTLHALPIAWAYEHWPILMSIFVALCILTVFCGLVSRLAGQISPRESRRRYLARMEAETRMAKLTGIPAGLIAESVPLDEIFIPVFLWHNRPRTDYPLTDSELEQYRQRVKSGRFPRDLDRVIMNAEKDWYHLLRQSDRLDLATFWEQLGHAGVAVVQGYPGMGKSTLVERLTLHMARRGLQIPDAALPDASRFEPTLLPILLRLGRYATARTGTADLPLLVYLERELDQLHIPGIREVVHGSLRDGRCLVLLDGLDEVSDAQMRQQVQEAIKAFISDYAGNSQDRRNRFIITSRVAGYDQAAFPDYDHYTIAELTKEQINAFLPRWCRATVQRMYGVTHGTRSAMKTESLEGEVEKKLRDLRAA